MEDDIDIYEDLPNFTTKDDKDYIETTEKIACECVQLRKQVLDLTEKLENFKQINGSLEVNLSSLLKTAKAEIARKDRMIGDLREQLENITFRRGHFNKPRTNADNKPPHSQQASEQTKREVPTAHTQVIEYEAVKSEVHYNEKEDQEVRYKPAAATVFTERLRKRIMEEEIAERKRKEMDTVSNVKSKTESVEGYVVESDKENGLESNVDNKENESHTVIRNTNIDNVVLHEKANTDPVRGSVEENNVDSERQMKSTLVTKYSGKRSNANAIDACSNKRVKTEQSSQNEIKYNGHHTFQKYDDLWNNARTSKAQDKDSNYEHGRPSEEKSHCVNDNLKKYKFSGEIMTHHRKPSNGYVPKKERITPESQIPSERIHSDRRSTERSNNDRRDNHRYNTLDYNDRPKSYERNMGRKSQGKTEDPKSKERRYSNYPFDKYKDSRVKPTQSNRQCDSKYNEGTRQGSCSRGSYDLRTRSKRASDEWSDNVESFQRDKRNRYEKWSRDRSTVETRSRSYSSERTNAKIDKDDKKLINRTRGSKSSRDTAENLKEKLKENNIMKLTEAKSIKEDTVQSTETISVSLEEGEIVDTPNSNRKENDQNTSLPTDSVLQSMLTSMSNIENPPPPLNDSSISLREERIENIERFIKNFDQKVEDPPIVKTSAAESLKYNDNITESTVQVLSFTGESEVVSNADSAIKNDVRESDPTKTAAVEDQKKISEDHFNQLENPPVKDCKDINVEELKPEEPELSSQHTVEKSIPESTTETEILLPEKNTLKGSTEAIDAAYASTDSDSKSEGTSDSSNTSNTSSSSNSSSTTNTSNTSNTSSNTVAPEEQNQINENVKEEKLMDQIDTPVSDSPVENDLKTIESKNAREPNNSKTEDVESFSNPPIKNLSNLDLSTNETESKVIKNSAVDDVLHNDPQTTEVSTKVMNKQDSSSNDHCKVIVHARRRKPVKLMDNNASMTIVVNSNSPKCNVSPADPRENPGSALKPRAWKLSRIEQ